VDLHKFVRRDSPRTPKNGAQHTISKA
jgi:hypothetical protein